MTTTITRGIGSVAVVLLVLGSDRAWAMGPQCAASPLPTGVATDRRTSWGDPDLQGVWSGAQSAGVPVDRDPELGARNLLTAQETEARKTRLIANAAADNIEATNFGIAPEVTLNSRQASLVLDPSNGRRPPNTPEANARPPAHHSFLPGPFNSAADFGTLDRCIAFSTVPASAPGNMLEIVQSSGYVVVRAEWIHEAQIVPLKGSAHVSPEIRTYAGDSRGHWDGRTLVVETTNFNGGTNLIGNAGGRPTERLKVTERFTLIDENTLWYEATIDDPGTWTQPWTLGFERKREPNGALYEYACHEGNYGLPNILRASRTAEKKSEK